MSSHARASSATASRLPDADRRTRERTLNRRPDVGYPRFRRNPFARDVLLDPGGMTVPRITALHMLRSTITTVSAPANSSFRGSITHPTQPLCTLRVRRYRRLTQHSLPGDLLGLTWAGLAPADRASFAWRLHLLDHLGTSHCRFQDRFAFLFDFFIKFLASALRHRRPEKQRP